VYSPYIVITQYLTTSICLFLTYHLALAFMNIYKFKIDFEDKIHEDMIAIEEAK
jgi:hypothetical protein